MQAHKIKKWSVSGITLPYPYVFWLIEHESEFRKRPSPSSFKQIDKKTPKLQNHQELQFHFENRYIIFFMHHSHLIPIYLYLSIMILISMKIHNPQILNKSSEKALKTVKNIFHIINAICPETKTLKLSHFSVIQFAGFHHGATEAL